MVEPATPNRIDELTVVGAGVMGHGIALAFASEGRRVRLYDADPDALDRARDELRSACETLRDGGRLDDIESVLDRIRFETDLADAVTGVDFVTEAVVEDLGVKQDVFADLDALTDDVILATNTSGLSVSDIATPVSDPERVVGTHWFNPPYIVPLVEVVYGDQTADDVADAAYALLEDIGKTPVTVEKDIPGFIGNRIQTAMAYEAFSLWQRGVASAEDIDRAVKAGFGFRLPVLGIFEKSDHSGLDVHHAVEKSLLPNLDRGTEPTEALTDLVERGDLGLKTGRGLFDWEDVDPEAVYRARDQALLGVQDVYEGGKDRMPGDSEKAPGDSEE